MIVPDTFEALARAHAYRRKLKFKRGDGYPKAGASWAPAGMVKPGSTPTIQGWF